MRSARVVAVAGLALFLLLAAPSVRADGSVALTVGSGAQSRTVWIDANEVTAGAFQSCVAAGACPADEVTAGDLSGACNYGLPARADHPVNCVSWHGAAAYCAAQGSRLCREEEWFAACRGPHNLDYPYGPEYMEGGCNASDRMGGPAGTEPVGSRPTCEGGTPGVFDMAGNLTEWVDSCNGDYCHFYGGAFRTNEPVSLFASCRRYCAGNQKTLKSTTVGFRCCRDTPPEVTPPAAPAAPSAPPVVEPAAEPVVDTAAVPAAPAPVAPPAEEAPADPAGDEGGWL